MRLLVFADLHLDAPFAWAARELARARRMSLRDTLVRVCELAAALQVDALCCAGDLYEQERFTPDTAQFLRATFGNIAPVPVFLAPGNHDWLGPPSLYRQVAWTPNVQVFTEPRLTAATLADGFTLWGAAHCAPANTPGFLDGFRVDRGGVHIGLFHGSEQGELAFEEAGKVPHGPFRAAQVAESGLHHALVGHFHTPRDGPHHTYPGNPEPLTFGEQGERGAVQVDIDGSGGVVRRRHRVASSCVPDLVVDLDGVVHSGEVRARVVAKLATLDHSNGRIGAVRVTLQGQVGSDVDVDLADLNGVAREAGVIDLDDAGVVVRLGRVDVAYDYDALASEATVRGQFVRDVRDAPELTDDQRRRVLITGLRALDGRRSDLEVR